MDYLRRAFADTRTTALTLGLTTMVVTHSAMVLDLLPAEWSHTQKVQHAYLNLVAAGAILYGTRVIG